MIDTLEYDCEVVAKWWDPELCYEWSMEAIVRDPATGKHYYYSDSGCSCDGPFEDGWTNRVEPVYSEAEAIKRVSEVELKERLMRIEFNFSPDEK